MWVSKIRAVLNGKKHFCQNALLKDSYEVSIIETEFSRKCGLSSVHGILTITSHGLTISESSRDFFITWDHFTDIIVLRSANEPDGNNICQLISNSDFYAGAGRLHLRTTMGAAVVTRAVRDAYSVALLERRDRRLSRSDTHLPDTHYSSHHHRDVGIRRSSWYRRPSDVSLDDTDLIMTKEANLVASGQLLRCTAADDLTPTNLTSPVDNIERSFGSTYDRKSSASLASGIYEEIPDISPTDDARAAGKPHFSIDPMDAENTYESVAECVYGTMRRTGKRCPPPPLPPRAFHNGSTRQLAQDTDEVDGVALRHASVSSFYKSGSSKTLPKNTKTKPFNVFRKRIKSESRITPPKEKEVKKKKFDFGGDMIRNFSVSRALLRNLRISSTNLSKLEARSCEFMDEERREDVAVAEPRVSKSVEVLGTEFDLIEEDGQDLSAMYNEEFSLPPDIVELILRGREELAAKRLRQLSESEYIAMSPRTDVSCSQGSMGEEHYTIMSPPPKSVPHHTVMSQPQSVPHYTVMSPPPQSVPHYTVMSPSPQSVPHHTAMASITIPVPNVTADVTT